MLKTSDLRIREVINIVDGKRLGLMSDIEVDLENGKVTAIVVPGPARIFGMFGRDRDYVIPWEKIVKIGEDVILVEVQNFTNPRHSR